jgi:hypothetical protein
MGMVKSFITSSFPAIKDLKDYNIELKRNGWLNISDKDIDHLTLHQFEIKDNYAKMYVE